MQTRNINIFISSTFNDMQSERDIIRKQIVRKLQEELAEYHVSIQVTDLRWGVDTFNVDEGERESEDDHRRYQQVHEKRTGARRFVRNHWDIMALRRTADLLVQYQI